MVNCKLCNNAVQKLLDLGLQPICHSFIKSTDEQYSKYPFILGLCRTCGLVQLITPFPVNQLKPIYDWITYKEPEEHLDKVADMLSKLLPSKDVRICGISFKDDSTLGRMNKLGFRNVIRLDVQKDLGADIPHGGVETIQSLLTIKKAKKIAEQYGKFDIIIARHIVEHAYDIFEFMNSIKELLKPEGYALFEVPDYTKPFELYDYSALWEEHIFYFTPQTFKNCFDFAGFSVEQFKLFSYPIENSLVAIVQQSGKAQANFSDKNALELERRRAMSFSNEFPKQKKLITDFFSKYSKNNGNLAIFGAGHSACLLINILDIGRHINCVIDDNVNKQGLLMPGSHIQIFDSSALTKRDIKLCIFVVNPNIEEKVIAKNAAYLRNGGKFLSFCPVSLYSVFSYIENSGSNNEFNFRKVDNQVYYAENPLVKVGNKNIKFLKDRLIRENLQRIRLCAHNDVNDAVHEMFIVLKKDTYIRPHKHLNKSESFHLIEGIADIIVFDDNGNVQEIIKMADYQSPQEMYYRMNVAYFHTVVVLSDFLVFHETTQGPFRKSDTVYAPWAPDESDIAAVRAYKGQLKNSVEKFLKK